MVFQLAKIHFKNTVTKKQSVYSSLGHPVYPHFLDYYRNSTSLVVHLKEPILRVCTNQLFLKYAPKGKSIECIWYLAYFSIYILLLFCISEVLKNLKVFHELLFCLYWYGDMSLIDLLLFLKMRIIEYDWAQALVHLGSENVLG